MNYLLAIILSLLISETASAWNLFGPKDFESCQEEAARDAKSKDALSILIDSCDSNYPARRKPQGGYYYYDFETKKYYDVSGPKPSKKDWEAIEKARLDAKKVEQEINTLITQLNYEKSKINQEPTIVTGKQIGRAHV